MVRHQEKPCLEWPLKSGAAVGGAGEGKSKFRIAREVFRPCNGAWGRKGCTNVHLLSAKAGELRRALEAAAMDVASRAKKKKC